MKKRLIVITLALSLLMSGCLSQAEPSSEAASDTNSVISQENPNGGRETPIKTQDEYDNPELEADVREIAEPYAEQSLDITKDSPQGRYYTDHKFDHALMVCDKAQEVGEAIVQAVENGTMGGSVEQGRVSFSADIDFDTLTGAALCHDIGMSGNGYAVTPVLDENGKAVKDDDGRAVYEKDDQGYFVMHPEDNDNFAEIRSNHSMNSGLYVLVDRDELKEIGYSDEDVDKMACECMAHSKSNSGVIDLNNTADWETCFDRMDSLVIAWNTDHPDDPISFNRQPFETDSNKLGSLASETLALRVGDVSRDSGPDAEAQSGEKVHVDRESLNDYGDSISEEVADAKITIGENGDIVDNEKDKQVHAGEQNIIDNHTYIGEDCSLIHEITVADGSSAPKCTQEAINDHLGELYSARDEHFEVIIIFGSFDDNDDDFFAKSWESFKATAEKEYTNITVIYDQEKSA